MAGLQEAIRRFALSLPNTEPSVACQGTSLECTTVTTRGKALLFLRATDARLKLRASLAEASELAKKQPDRYTVGANGWVHVRLEEGSVPRAPLERWIEESHGLIAGAGPAAARAKRPASAAARKAKRRTTRR